MPVVKKQQHFKDKKVHLLPHLRATKTISKPLGRNHNKIPDNVAMADKNVA